MDLTGRRIPFAFSYLSCPCDKTSVKNHLGKEGVLWVHSLRAQPSWWKVTVTVMVNIASTVRKQREMKAYTLFAFSSLLTPGSYPMGR